MINRTVENNILNGNSRVFKSQNWINKKLGLLYYNSPRLKEETLSDNFYS